MSVKRSRDVNMKAREFFFSILKFPSLVLMCPSDLLKSHLLFPSSLTSPFLGERERRAVSKQVLLSQTLSQTRENKKKKRSVSEASNEVMTTFFDSPSFLRVLLRKERERESLSFWFLFRVSLPFDPVSLSQGFLS